MDLKFVLTAFNSSLRMRSFVWFSKTLIYSRPFGTPTWLNLTPASLLASLYWGLDFQLSFIFYQEFAYKFNFIRAFTRWFWTRKKGWKSSEHFFFVLFMVKTDSTHCTVPRFALNLKISKPLTRKTIVLKLSLLTEICTGHQHWLKSMEMVHF